MPRSVFPLSVSVEQVATAIKQMSPADQERLLDLVPELRQVAAQTQPRTVEEARAAIEQVRAEVAEALGGQPLSGDELFLGDRTLREYLELPDEDRTSLWDEWTTVNLEDLEELDVRPDALSTG